jgi:CheY-specific phosphatase CheX
METRITQDDLCQLTLAIWESTLGLGVQPISRRDPSDHRAGILIAQVKITGTWLGTVLLECSGELAKKVARVMFAIGPKEPSLDQVRDALAEMTNITAGNLKSLVGGHCHLSMPQVTERENQQPIGPESAVITRQAFDCQGEPFGVTILEGC